MQGPAPEGEGGAIKRPRSTSAGAGAGVHGAFESDADHRLGPGAQTDLAGVLARVLTGFTGPSGVVDLSFSYERYDDLNKAVVLRKLWERAGGPRVVVLESPPLKRYAFNEADIAARATARAGFLGTPGFFEDPFDASATKRVLKISESFPCTPANAELLADYAVVAASATIDDDDNFYSGVRVTLRIFDMPVASVDMHHVRTYACGGRWEPWQSGYTGDEDGPPPDDVPKSEFALRLAQAKADDGVRYRTTKLAQVRELARLWVAAEVGAIGRTPAAPLAAPAAPPPAPAAPPPA